MVTDHQLQGVLARGQLEAGLGLAAAEVTMMIVGWNRLTGRRQLIGIDQQMVVAGCGALDASRGNAHATEPELHCDR